MKKLLIIALCFTLTVQLSAQIQSDGRASVGVQNGSKHFDVAAHLRQLKINEMNSQARMKRVQSKPAALRTASPMHRNPGAVQPEKPVSVQPKAPARKAVPAASAKPRSAANNGGFWKYKEKLDSIVEDNGNRKRIFEYDYDGNVTNESVYGLQNDKTWSLSETYEYNYDDNNVIKSKIYYRSYWDNKPHYRRVEYYDTFGHQSSRIDYNYNYDNDEFVPSTKYEYYHDQWGYSSDLKQYNYQDGEWVLDWDSHVEVEYDDEGRLIYICDTQNNLKNEYYYDENGNLYDKARYSYISEEVGFVCTYLVTLDENNRVTSEEEYNITDRSTGATELIYKQEYEYDENGNMTADLLEHKDWLEKHEYRYVNFYNAETGSYNMYQTVRYNYCWSNDTWVGDGTGYEWVYDENGNLTMYKDFVWDDETKGWKGSYKEEREYDGDGNLTLYEKYLWDDEAKGWKGNYKEEREYDENGNQTLYEEFVWDDETEGWKGNYKAEREYDGDGNLTITDYRWDGENGQWHEHPKSITKYDENGNQTWHEVFVWNEETKNWDGSYIDEYVYDEYSNCTKFFYWWNGGNGQWHEHPKTITKYDENGREILYEDYKWDDNNNVWVASQKSEYYWTPSPDGDGYDQYYKARYTVVNGEFVCTYNAEIDDQKRIISEEGFNINWDLGTAVPYNKSVYVYDDNGEIHNMDSYTEWDSEMEHYKYWYHTYYNSSYKEVFVKTSEYKDGEYVATQDVEFDDHGEVLKVTDVANPDNYTEYENAYNESGQLIYQISKYYEVSGLNNQERHDFEYDDKGRLCLDLYSSWNGEDWTESEKYEYNYEAFDTYNVGKYQKTTKLIAVEWRVTNEQGALKLDEGGYKRFSDTYDYDWSTGALTGCNIREYTYDAKGNQIGYKRADGVTEDGIPRVQSEAEYVYILDFNEWRGTKQITSVQSEWDDTQNKLVEKKKSTTEKTEEGVTILTIQTSYDGTEWTTESCYELEYDEDGVLISSAQLVNNEGTFTRNGATKYAKKYDSNGYTLLDAKYSGDENEHWAVVYEKRYEYYENGNRAVEMVEDRQHSWNIYKYEKRYDENGNQTFEEQYTWDSSKGDNGDWVGTNKNIYAYDENGNCTLEEQYTWDSSKGDNGDWVASWKSEWYLNEYGWNSDKARYEVVNGEFVCTYLVTLDDNNRVISEEEYNITDRSTGATELIYKQEYEYDENGNMTADLLEHKDWLEKHEYRYVNFYNAETGSYNMYQTVRYNYCWSNDTWVGDGTGYEWVYDENGNITKETSFRWDSENDEWYIQNQSSYTFDMNVLTADIAMKEGQYSQYNGKCKLLSLESSEYHEWESSYYDNKKEYFYSVFGYYYYVDGESHEIIPDGDEFVGEDLTLIDKQTYSANTDFTVGNLTYKRTFVDSEWNALYVPFNIPVETLDEEGLQAAEILTTHIYDDDQDGTVDRTTIEVVPVVSGELEANVPYVIRAKELEGEKEVEINLSNILVHESENNSVDCSSTKQLFTFTGTYEPVTGETLFTDGLYYIGINAETQNVAIVQAGSAETPSLPAQRWTLAVTDRFGNKVVSNVRAIDIIMDEDATGIEAIGAGAESATDVYNVAGVKVATMTAGQSIKNLALPAGVYVNNGHKFIIK